MLILDLCCGTQSLKETCNHLSYKYIGLDINEITDKKKPDICVNILDWDYVKYFQENEKPDLIWFSPPCTEYSCLNNARPNKTPNIKLANEIVQKGLEIIKYCDCKFILENPQTGTLKDQNFMIDLEFTDVDYCRYGFPYKKRTRLWNNIKFMGNLCMGKDNCEFMKNGKHLYSIGNSSYLTNVKDVNTKKSRLGQRFSIPNRLIEDIFKKWEEVQKHPI